MACSVPALQPMFKRWLDSRSTRGTTLPGARNNPVLLSWDDSTGLTLLSRPRSSRSTSNRGSWKDEELGHLPEERGAKSITTTGDAGHFDPQAKDSWEGRATQAQVPTAML